MCKLVRIWVCWLKVLVQLSQRYVPEVSCAQGIFPRYKNPPANVQTNPTKMTMLKINYQEYQTRITMHDCRKVTTTHSFNQQRPIWASVSCCVLNVNLLHFGNCFSRIVMGGGPLKHDLWRDVGEPTTAGLVLILKGMKTFRMKIDFFLRPLQKNNDDNSSRLTF